MFCPSCRANNAEGAVFCGSCGARLATGAVASPPKTSGLAIASLVLGVLGFCCGLFSITGLILGIVGLLKIGRSAGQLGGKGLAIAGICVSGAALVFWPLILLPQAALLMPALARARTEARKAACMNNLHQVGLGLQVYASEHGGQFPDKLGDLSQYVPASEVFVCPADSRPMVSQSGLKTSYHYVGSLLPKADGAIMIMYDKKGNHPHGRCAQFVDARTEFISEEDFPSRLKESLELVKQHWDEYPPERQAAIEAFYEDRMPE